MRDPKQIGDEICSTKEVKTLTYAVQLLKILQIATGTSDITDSTEE